MLNTAQGNLVIVGLKNVFWKGKPVVGVTNIHLKSSVKGTKISLIIKNGDSEVIAELRNSGVYVRREK